MLREEKQDAASAQDLLDGSQRQPNHLHELPEMPYIISILSKAGNRSYQVSEHYIDIDRAAR